MRPNISFNFLLSHVISSIKRSLYNVSYVPLTQIAMTLRCFVFILFSFIHHMIFLYYNNLTFIYYTSLMVPKLHCTGSNWFYSSVFQTGSGMVPQILNFCHLYSSLHGHPEYVLFFRNWTIYCGVID